MRARLELPEGQLAAAAAAAQTFGDYLNFHPHLHVLAASGLVDSDGRFHVLPVDSIEPLAELFRHRFLALLRREKLISESKLRQLLAWNHSGFSLDASEKPVASSDVEGRKRLAEYLLRAPFSLEKITWNESTGKVIYRSKRSWHTKRNFQIFEAVDFLAAVVEHIPPKRQQTVRYYGLYSNKSRGMAAKTGRLRPEMADAKRHEKTEALPPGTLFILPAPEPRSGRALRPLWRDLIMKVWGEDPHKCPCCHGTMNVVGTMIRRSEVDCHANASLVACHEPMSHHHCRRETRKECPKGALNFFCDCTDFGNGSEADIDCRQAARRVARQRHQRIVALPPPPDPPFDIEKRRGIGGVLDGGASSAARQTAFRQPEGKAKRSQPGARRGARRAGRAGRANQTMEPIEVPPQAV